MTEATFEERLEFEVASYYFYSLNKIRGIYGQSLVFEFQTAMHNRVIEFSIEKSRITPFESVARKTGCITVYGKKVVIALLRQVELLIRF